MPTEHNFLTLDGLPPGIRAEIDGHLGRLVFDRPHKKNTLTQELWLAVPAAVERMCGSGDLRVLIVEGAGGTFCAGADIGEFETVRRDAATAMKYERANADAFLALRDAPLPTVAKISGVAFGGGFGLAAACDIRIADNDSMFAVPAAKLGLAYPAEAVADIVHAIGAQNARQLFFTARRFSAAQMLDWGFLGSVAAAGELDAAVAELASDIAANAPLTNRAAKAAIRAVLSGSPKDMIAAKALGDATFASADYAEGRAAFAARRKPLFRGC